MLRSINKRLSFLKVVTWTLIVAFVVMQIPAGAWAQTR